MKTLASLALVLPLAGWVLAEQLPAQTVPVPADTVVVTQVIFTPEQLDTLLGPIALYPDALIALILPASTNSADVVLAARYLGAGGDVNQVDSQPWDESVQALARYPQIVQWMDENLAWTKQLGGAFVAQPADVMNAVQRLRARARAAGTLVDTAQQRVVYDGSTIEIVPAEPDVIYVPYYDPAIVYAPPPSYYGYGPSAFFNFSSGFVAGWWLSFGVDWHDRCVWNVRHEDRERFWQEHRHDPRRYVGPAPQDHRQTAPVVRTWHPRADRNGPRSYPPMRPLPTPPTGPGSWGDRHRDVPPHDANVDHRNRDWPVNRGAPLPPTATAVPAVGPSAPSAPQTTVPRVAPLAQVPAGPRPHDDWRGDRGHYQTPAPQAPTRPSTTVSPSPSTNPPPRMFAPPYGSVGMPMPPSRVAPAPQPSAPPPAPHRTFAPPPPPPPPPAPPPQQQPSSQQQQSQSGDDSRRNPNAREH